MSNPLTISAITAGYGASTVVHEVSLTVLPGRITAVLGKNGVGKTTLIRSIAGHCRVRSGSVRIADHDLTNLPAHKIARSGVGLVPQGRRLFPTLTVREHLMVGQSKPVGSRAHWNLQRVGEHFPRIAERLDHFGTKLSGGEQSMVAIGRALVGNPLVLLLDEPSEGLAPMLVNQLAQILMTLKDEGMSILLVEQNYGLAMKVSDEINIMSKGKIVFTGTPAELRSAADVKSRYLGV